MGNLMARGATLLVAIRVEFFTKFAFPLFAASNSLADID
jgi:hypothetical protein